MSELDIRELECFLVLAEELHFGRTGQRLYVSQSRVSQLLRSLERRIGAPLVERTSRRVVLTPLGQRLLNGLRPAYAALRAAVADARAEAHGVDGVLRLGFQGTADERVLNAIDTFCSRYPRCTVEITELPLSDPFGALRRGQVDTAAVLLPSAEPDLVVGPVFGTQPQTLAVSVRNPFASRTSLSAEELAECALITPGEPAPDYWRHAQAPTVTPGGRPIPRGPTVTTLQEGIAMAAANRGAMLLCAPTASHHTRRDISFVPVSGLPGSVLALVRRHGADDARLRAFWGSVAEAREPEGAQELPELVPAEEMSRIAESVGAVMVR
ncbi:MULTISPECIES: LysR family transcriptional regulator [Streptomycetaceae]|uniref:Transcriptional regulator, LysR family n=1 Tax=Streptantibioticus cattleyicolor (strain ATCC 35852 / DSM 46488 / JCM 4925 / NBRC 14057 / NRRL 8057) TaxID=1003195 RepID=F8K1R0_STREN|nr:MULTISPECIES: LysR family transcriptional regulator [Streptomycetaceae]AEW92379.1 transcriptional regulator, LysR family [Streptantibioticus cattleyicolor NRRL 8057 = DSM 46488]MYS57193.1 LysR family transcriptional regulator [Streptomyces sp. SID5468]CCB72744.1 putative transcriptional regulator [Streptantibioticus cattleyicolor NRRL 8057 = DSM 46488]